ncbi:MAG: hypothetical protein B7Z73_13110, partial [Planctomycetia bacterium 21-64-5]
LPRENTCSDRRFAKAGRPNPQFQAIFWVSGNCCCVSGLISKPLTTFFTGLAAVRCAGKTLGLGWAGFGAGMEFGVGA